MRQKVAPGLILRGDTWHIAKTIAGQRIRESCQTSDLEEAERYLAFKMEQIRQANVYGVRPKRTFREAATRYLNEATKTTLRGDADNIKLLEPFIGDLPLEAVHMGTLQPFIEDRKAKGSLRKKADKDRDEPPAEIKARTINAALQVVRHVLNLAAGTWIDEHGQTWLQHAPKIQLLPEADRRAPYPLSWKEQEALFGELPDHLRQMCLFKVNTGCREAEVCSLLWEWEVKVPQLETSVFIIPGHKVKNREDRLVVLNSIARRVIEEQRGLHPIHVFAYEGRPVSRMYTAAFRKARTRVKLEQVRIHDLKHTYGRRLRAAGVSLEDRQDLLGHKSGKITTHYSAPELINLIQASERVCAYEKHKPDTIVILRKRLSVVGAS